MRTRTYRTALLSTLLLAGCTPRETMPELTDRVFAVAAAQYEQLEGRLTDETLPRSVASDGKFIPSNIRWWCSGFYPGSLWYIYEYTGDKTFRELAEKNTFKLYPLKQKGTDHDLGFQMNCSFGNAYRITGEGICSWYDFASEIIRLSGVDATVSPCTSEEYKAKHPDSADRPKWSALDNRMLRCTVGNDVRDWKDALACFFEHWDGDNGMK